MMVGERQIVIHALLQLLVNVSCMKIDLSAPSEESFEDGVCSHLSMDHCFTFVHVDRSTLFE